MTKPSKTDAQKTAVSPLSVKGLRARNYSSKLTIIKEIEVGGRHFRSFLASYLSDGLKVFARINIPAGETPERGFPIIVFAHGYSPDPPDPNYFQRPYYETWTNAYAEAGFVVLMPGYRGHGIVEGVRAEGGEYLERYSKQYLTSPFYAIDILNLLAGLSEIPALNWRSFGIRPQTDVNNIFLSAHSMGGDVALIMLAVSCQVKAASIWAGVCADLQDIAAFYTQYEIKEGRIQSPLETAIAVEWEKVTAVAKAEPFLLDDVNLANGFFFLEDIGTPIILHQGTGDMAVSPVWSVTLHEKLLKAGRQSVLYLYKGNNHELSLNDEHLVALERDAAFFRNHI